MTENSWEYQQWTMRATNGGRTVATIDGDHGAITWRGGQIARMGERMKQSADILQQLSEGQMGEGGSIDALREHAGKVYEDLRVAGTRYADSAEHLLAYGSALSTVQGETDTLVANAIDAWEDVRNASIALEQASGVSVSGVPNLSTLSGENEADAEQQAFDNAVETWEGYWSQYDAPVLLWERAYDSAASGLEDVNEDGVSDGFWDNAMPFVEGLLEVLMWVGLALAIAAFFITGPLAAILAVASLVVGVVVVLLEASKFLADRGDPLALTLAIVSVVPFGKIAKFTPPAAGSGPRASSRHCAPRCGWARGRARVQCGLRPNRRQDAE